MKDIRGMIEDLLELESGLTTWELDFIKSVSKQADNPKWEPTEKQATTIVKLYERLCR